MRLARVILALLALVLALGAADPTPRFLGLPRAGESSELPSQPSQARAVHHDYDIPAGLSVRQASRPRALAAPALPAPQGRGPAAQLTLEFSRSSPRAAALALARRSSLAPPLRL